MVTIQKLCNWKYFYPTALPQTSLFFPSFFLSNTPSPHTFSMFQNAWWPIYYWRGTPTDKQIPRNEVIWSGHVYTNTAEGFYGWCFLVSLYRSPPTVPLYPPLCSQTHSWSKHSTRCYTAPQKPPYSKTNLFLNRLSGPYVRVVLKRKDGRTTRLDNVLRSDTLATPFAPPCHPLSILPVTRS